MGVIVICCLIIACGLAHAAILNTPQNETLTIPEPRIAGGAETSITQYPFMVKLWYNWLWWFWTYRCAGSLISETTILSAASCYTDTSPSYLEARVGSSTISGGTTFRVSMITIHSDYASNDIALIRLASPVSLTPTVNVALIPGNSYELADGTSVTAVGWGATSPGSDSTYSQLRQAKINIINQDICAERYEFLKTQPGYQDVPSISSGMFCAGILDEGGKGPCLNDKGGPIVHEGNIVVGVIAWSRYRCANAYYPGVNTRVSYYSDWIVQYGSI